MGWTVQSSFGSRITLGATVSRQPGRATALFDKSVIIFDGRTETWVLNTMYTGIGDLWGCFGPLPRESRCKPTTRSLVERLDQSVEIPSFDEFRGGENSIYFRSRQTDIYNLEIMRTMGDIQQWKRRNGFRDITEKENAVFHYYFDREMNFFGALLSYGYPSEGDTVSVWTQPVQVTFHSDRIRFPLRSGTTGDGTHSFLSFDLLTSNGWPDVPAKFNVKFEGQFELGRQLYNHVRVEARLTFDQMEDDFDAQIRTSSIML